MMWEADEQDLWQDVPQRQGAANGPAVARGDRFVTGNLTSDDLDVGAACAPSFLTTIAARSISAEPAHPHQAAQSRGETLDHVVFSGPPGLGKTTLAPRCSPTKLARRLKTTSAQPSSGRATLRPS